MEVAEGKSIQSVANSCAAIVYVGNTHTSKDCTYTTIEKSGVNNIYIFMIIIIIIYFFE